MQKGSYGFHKKKKQYELLKTLLLFAIVVAVYLTGLFATGSNKNLMTIVAVLGVLPASKSAVSMLMFLRYSQIEETAYQQMDELAAKSEVFPPPTLLYDLIFVLNEKVVKTEAVFIQGSHLFVYVSQSKMSDSDITKYLKNFLSNHGKGNCGIKTVHFMDAFLEQIRPWLKKGSDEETAGQQEKQEKLVSMLLGFSM